MGILDHLTCPLRNLYAGKKQQNWTWNNRLVQNLERSTSMLYTVPTSKEQQLRRLRRAERSYSMFKVRRGGQ